MDRRAKYEGEPLAGGLEPLLISMEELQRLLRVGRTTAFALVGSEQIESVLVGSRRMPVYESAKAYVKRLREQAKAAA